MAERKLRMGIAGLGRAFTLMLPTLAADTRVELTAAADPRTDATRQFNSEFGGRVYASVAELADDPDVDVIYIATPHQYHAEHVQMAAARGKHALVEKPMAVTLGECKQMIEAVEGAGVQLVVGHSHSFDRPIRRAREIIDGGSVGAVRMINAQYYTDFMYRPRRPEELISDQGGGVVLSQGAHQVDIVRLLAGGRARSVRAVTGAWDPSRAAEGAYVALLMFDDDVVASLVYSGYGHFDGDEFCGWIGELGVPKDASRYGAARKNLRGAADPDEEVALKNARNYGGHYYAPQATPAPFHQHFGSILISCDRADLRPLSNGVMIYADEETRMDALAPPQIPRAEVIDELYAAVVHGRRPLHDGRWAMSTLEVCLAIRQSARERREIRLEHQTDLAARMEQP